MPPGSSGSNTSSPWKRPVNANSAESRLPILSPYALPDGSAGSILPLPGPTATLQPLSKPLPGAISAFLSLWPFPASLSGAKSAFSIPNSPSAPRSKALPGSKLVILSQQPFRVSHARVAGPEQERYACPSTRSGCAVPCGASRSQARVPSLPGPANPALSAPGKLELWRVVS